MFETTNHIYIYIYIYIPILYIYTYNYIHIFGTMLGVFNMKETPCGSLGPCYLNLRHRTVNRQALPDIPCHNRHKPSGCSLSAGIASGCKPSDSSDCIPSGCSSFGCNPSGCSSFGSSRSCHHSRTSGRCKGHRGQLYQWSEEKI